MRSLLNARYHGDVLWADAGTVLGPQMDGCRGRKKKRSRVAHYYFNEQMSFFNECYIGFYY